MLLTPALNNIELVLHQPDPFDFGLVLKQMINLFLEMVPLVGIELTTYRLQGGCSTN